MDPTKSLAETDLADVENMTAVGSLTTGAQIIPKQLGDFEIGPEIGRGGMGIVYIAHERGLGRKVALKILPTNSQLSPSRVQRFLVEARAAAQLNHDNIVPIYHIGVDSGTHYFAMKWIDGQDLAEVISAARKSLSETERAFRESTVPSKQPRTEDELGSLKIDLTYHSFSSSMQSNGTRSAHRLAISVALIGQQIAEALQHAHERGIVHRDIKPSNLMLDVDQKVWVTDFGLAQLQNAPALTQTGDIVGTLRYMSPEQASGRRAFVDNRTDIYSLGVALYELVTLRHACRGQTAREILREVTFERPTPIRKINPRLPRDFETIICKATERNPADRYQTAAEMAADLRRFANNQSLVARRTSKLKRVRDWLYERPVLTTVAAAGVFILLASLSMAAAALKNNLTVEHQKRVETEALLSESEGRRLQTLSVLARDENPGLAVALALEGTQAAPGFAANQAIMSAASVNHEAQHIPLTSSSPGNLAFSADGTRVLVCCNRRLFTKPTTTAIYDTGTGAKISELAETEPITTAAFGSDGRLLITSGASDSRGTSDPNSLLAMTFSPLVVRDARSFDKLMSFRNARVSQLTGAEFSPDCQRLLLPCADNVVRVYNTRDWSANLSLLHEQPVIQAIYSPDGTRIATWSENQTAILWDAATGNELHRIAYVANRPLDVTLAFSPDSSQLMLRGDAGLRVHAVSDPKVQLFRRETMAEFGSSNDRIYILSLDRSAIYIFSRAIGKVIAECTSDQDIEKFVVSTDDERIAAVCNRDIKIFDARSGTWLADCRGHSDWIEGIASRPFSDQFASVSWDDTLRIWNVKSDAELRTLAASIQPNGPPILDYSSTGKQALVASVAGFHTSHRQVGDLTQTTKFRGELEAVLPDGSVLTTENGTVTVWHATSSKLLSKISLPGQFVIEAKPLPGRPEVLLLTRAGTLLRWNLNTGQTDQLSGLGEVVADMVVNPTTGNLLMGLLDGKLLSVDVENSRKTLAEYDASIGHLDVDRQGTHVLIVTGDDRVHIWDLQANAEQCTIFDTQIPIKQAWFARGDEYVVTHAYMNTKQVGLWHADDGQLEATANITGVREVALDAEGNRLAVASYAQGGILWDLLQNQQTTVTEKPCRAATFVDGKLVFATERRRTLISAENPEAITKMEPALLLSWDLEQAAIQSQAALAFNASMLRSMPGGAAFVVSGKTYGAEAIEIESGISTALVLDHTDIINLAAFAPNDQTILTASSDGKVQLYEMNTGQQIPLGEHAYQLTAIALSPDRKLLLSSDASGRTLQWDLVNRTVREREQDATMITQHAIGSSGNMAASVVAPTKLEVWDLRSGKGSQYEFEKPVQHLVIAPDEKSLLLVCGPHKVSPSATTAFDRMGYEADGEVIMLEIPSGQKRTVAVEGAAAAIQFLDAGKRFAVLSSQHHIDLFDAKTLAPQLQIETNPACLGLLAANGESTQIHGTGRNRFAAWDALTGEQTLDLPLELSAGAADGDLREWMVHHPGSEWMLIFRESSVVKFPVEPYRYATDMAPRKLTPAEKARYLLTIEPAAN